jgi:hypothetical protein
MIKVTWNDGRKAHEREVETREELDEILDTLHAARASVIVDIEHPSGDVLGVALGGAESALFYSQLPAGDAYTSVGDGEREGPSVDFAWNGEITEVLPRMLIPLEQARAAVAEFVTTGRIPTKVKMGHDWA